ncbi:MAG: STAS domain-containing protein [Planctomycetes bacterium]|nr:STAS domain-containing protein [Planctomycetota bacterium]
MNDSKQSRPKPPGYIEVAREGNSVLIRVVGLGNMNISLTMKDFVKESLAAGFRKFALDLDKCSGMDSTFMGTIIAINFRVNEQGGWLCLLNVNEECRKLLKMLGVWGLVPVKERFVIESVETECLLPGGDPARRMKHIRIAHEHLVQIDERNHERFGSFLAALEIEMAPVENASKDTSGESDNGQTTIFTEDEPEEDMAKAELDEEPDAIEAEEDEQDADSESTLISEEPAEAQDADESQPDSDDNDSDDNDADLQEDAPETCAEDEAAYPEDKPGEKEVNGLSKFDRLKMFSRGLISGKHNDTPSEPSE